IPHFSVATSDWKNRVQDHDKNLGVDPVLWHGSRPNSLGSDVQWHLLETRIDAFLRILREELGKWRSRIFNRSPYRSSRNSRMEASTLLRKSGSVSPAN